MLMMLVDDLMGATVYSRLGNEPKTTVSLSTDFLSAVQAGDWIEGVGEISRRTRTLIFVRAMLQVGERSVLSAQGVWKFVRRGHAPAAA
jgi:acyl-coenzyme A thioesterase PaaI-like protein